MKTSAFKTGLTKADFFNTVYSLNKKGGPETSEYGYIDTCMNSIAEMIENNIINKDDIQSIKEECDFLKSEDSVMGHIKLKPFGYAGDSKSALTSYT